MLLLMRKYSACTKKMLNMLFLCLILVAHLEQNGHWEVSSARRMKGK